MRASDRENVEIHIHHEGDAVVLTPVAYHLGSKDFALLVERHVEMLRDALKLIIIDFAHVRRLSFAACAYLVRMRQLAVEAGRELAVRNRPQRLKAEMALYHIDEMIDGYTHVGTQV